MGWSTTRPPCGPAAARCLTGIVKQSIDAAYDDHPDDDEDRVPAWWIVNVSDDCEGCADLRVEVTLELPGDAERVTAHLAPGSARRLRAALASALGTIGEPTDEPRAGS